MADKHILHMLSPLKHVSPFDVNMALDAGFDAVVPYEEVQLGEITGLVQDAIFSRPPKAGVRTCVFIGGRDAILALDMMEAAAQAMVPPFAISVFADPAGSFTTAAALVARAELAIQNTGHTLKDARIAIYGATGVVGFAAAVIAALEGAQVSMVGYQGIGRVARAAHEIERRFNVTVRPVDGSTEDKKAAILAESDMVFCTGKAGVQILSAAQVQAAPNLLVAADVNAVPPMGVEGLDVHADATPLAGTKTLGIGALAIGQTKYGVEIGLFQRMIEAKKPVRFDFRDAFKLARKLAA